MTARKNPYEAPTYDYLGKATEWRRKMDKRTVISFSNGSVDLAAMVTDLNAACATGKPLALEQLQGIRFLAEMLQEENGQPVMLPVEPATIQAIPIMPRAYRGKR